LISTLVLAAALAATPEPSLRGATTADLDRRVDPCADFFEFSSGGWRAANPIPDGKPRWSRRLAAREANAERLRGLLEELAARTDWPAGSVQQLAGDHYASCMDVAAADAAGLTPLRPLLAGLAAVRTPADLQRSIRRLHALAIPVGFGATGGFDDLEPRRFVLSVVPGGLGLDRDLLLGTEPRAVEARARYAAHLARLLELAGTPGPRAGKAAALVVALEQRLAGGAGAAGTPAPAAARRPTFAGLQALAPSFDWAAYFDEAKLPRADVQVPEPGRLQAFERELRETPVSTWRSYLAVSLLDAASPWLSRPFADEAFEFRERFLGGADSPRPRALRCAESTEALFPDPVGRLYAERHFPPATRARVQALLRNLLEVLKEEASRADWMTPETRRKAQEKLAAYDMQVGQPERWVDFSGVRIRRGTLWANVAAARGFGVEDNRRQVGQPTDPGRWQLPASSSGAYLDLQLDAIVLPAGFLQPPTFDPEANDAVNYGAFGAAVAHDMTHAIDTLGAENDVLGRPVSWWTDADTRGFEARARCVVDQFEGYFIEPGVHHKGKLVLREAVGDLAGLRLALLALQRSMATRPVPTVDGFTPEQQFFIAAAQARSESIRPEALRKMIEEDTHPVPRFRVNGALSNLPEFHRAFSCAAGAKMVRPPELRCAVW